MVGVPDWFVMRDNSLPKDFGDATTAPCCIVVAAHEGVPLKLATWRPPMITAKRMLASGPMRAVAPTVDAYRSSRRLARGSRL